MFYTVKSQYFYRRMKPTWKHSSDKMKSVPAQIQLMQWFWYAPDKNKAAQIMREAYLKELLDEIRTICPPVMV